MTTTNEILRVCALSHDALGMTRVKVIFKEGGSRTADKAIKNPKETAYWMTQETYRAIPIGQPATIEDYQKIGEVVEAQNLDIYSSL